MLDVTFLSMSTVSLTFLELGELATIDCRIIICDSIQLMLLSVTTNSLLSFLSRPGLYSSEEDESSTGLSMSRVALTASETALMMVSYQSEWNSSPNFLPLRLTSSMQQVSLVRCLATEWISPMGMKSAVQQLFWKLVCSKTTNQVWLTIASIPTWYQLPLTSFTGKVWQFWYANSRQTQKNQLRRGLPVAFEAFYRHLARKIGTFLTISMMVILGDQSPAMLLKQSQKGLMPNSMGFQMKKQTLGGSLGQVALSTILNQSLSRKAIGFSSLSFSLLISMMMEMCTPLVNEYRFSRPSFCLASRRFSISMWRQNYTSSPASLGSALKTQSRVYPPGLRSYNNSFMSNISAYPLEELFANLRPFLANPAPFQKNWFDTTEYFQAIPTTPILVVGAGGLGSEIVKNLALSGIRQIHLIDMDTIDYTNLNRQFMFREKDIGRHKADVVAQFVRKRCPGLEIHTYKSKVQEMPYAFYTQFPIIVGGLDNIEARQYLNKIVFLINEEEMETACYYLDGATEGFEGQSLLVDPYKTSCYECSLLDGLVNKPKVNYCTIANKPRTPEHCIQYVLEKQWQEERKGQLRDNDNLQHLNWIYEKALARAKEFNIEGLTPMLSLGVTKNVIPAIASTNALIAAVTTNEVFKVLSGCNPSLSNYFLYKGGTFIGSQTEQLAKKPNCSACLTRQNRLQKINIHISQEQKLSVVLEEVKQKYGYVNRPFVDHDHKILLNPGDNQRYEQRLDTPLGVLVSTGRLKVEEGVITLLFTDKCLKSQLTVQLQLST